MKGKLFIILVLLFSGCSSKTTDEILKSDFSKVPGTVISHLPASEKSYLGSPCIVIMPNGDYLVSYDVNSFDKINHQNEKTIISKSTDKGKTWAQIAEIRTQHWSTLFYHNGALYIIGTNGKYGDVVIQKSLDGGKTWTYPRDKNTGLLAEGEYHTAPVPVVIHNGRLWRAMECRKPGKGIQAFMISVPVDADLLKRSNWTFSNKLSFDDSWLHGANGWKEGNAVITPEGEIVNIIRVQATSGNDDAGGSTLHSTAAMIHISDDGRLASFDPEKDFINMPGASGKKFTIRFDPQTNKYWSLVNWIQPEDLKHLKHQKAGRIRNTLALVSSKDLRNWLIERIVLHIPYIEDSTTHRAKQGFQYADFQIEGKDMIFVLRTAWDDGLGGAFDYHNANFITFHRIKNFRKNFLNE